LLRFAHRFPHGAKVFLAVDEEGELARMLDTPAVASRLEDRRVRFGWALARRSGGGDGGVGFDDGVDRKNRDADSYGTPTTASVGLRPTGINGWFSRARRRACRAP
jgi:hypothetical protein